MNLRHVFIRNWVIIALLTVYFLFHLINLTLLPIFNDESIYLDWAWFHTHMPGRLYDSLLDAKQPLMIWIFGMSERFFPDPLFAGRFTSVMIGAIIVVGIYKLAFKLVSKNTALLAAFLYFIVPIFVFYNRQALMEAGVACIGIWSSILLINFLTKPSIGKGAILGVIWGIGFLVKSSSLIFIASSLILIIYFVLKEKNKNLLKSSFWSFIAFFAVNFLIFINPTFWENIFTNDRYVFSASELFSFPIKTWFLNLVGFFEIGSIFITPFILLFSFVGLFVFWKSKNKPKMVFVIYFLTALLLEIFLVKSQSQRYIMPFLPFLVIPASYILQSLWSRKIYDKLFVIFSLIIPLTMSLGLILIPHSYILELHKITKYSEIGYIKGQTSGYGINEAMQYIKDNPSSSSPNMIFFGLNLGNPENAIDLYSSKDPRLFALRIDKSFFPDIDQYDCMESKYPAFLITRNDQLLGVEKYFREKARFSNPFDSTYSVGVYTLQNDCEDNVFDLSSFYQPAIDSIKRIK